MSDDEPKALILRPAYGLQQPGSGGEKVLTRIVSDALTIARGRAIAPTLIRVGNYEFREQDYQQILIWADATEKSPEELVSLLAQVKNAFSDGSSFLVENGAIKQVAFPSSILKIKQMNTVYGQELGKCSCCENDLTALDLSNVPALTALYCAKNQLTELDLSNVPELDNLYCSQNQLTELDLSKVPALTALHCDYNRLTALDLSNLPELIKLYCHENQLTELDISHVPKLNELDCRENQITEIDLSNVPELNGPDCRSYQLIGRDIGLSWRRYLKYRSYDPSVKVKGLRRLSKPELVRRISAQNPVLYGVGVDTMADWILAENAAT